MSKKTQLTEFNRTNILNAAKVLFSERGIVQTTMDDIAKKSEYSKSTIYVYFKSKEEILDYIVLEFYKLLKNGIEEVLRNTPEFPESYYKICYTAAKFCDNYPLYFDYILEDVIIPEEDDTSVLSQIYSVGEQINNIIKYYMKICISNGKIRSDLNGQTTFALWGGICGIISLTRKKENYIRHKMNISKEEFLQSSFELILRSIT